MMLLNGGNQKLRELFEEYGIPREGPFINKYKTKAAVYYREKLKALAEDQPVPEAPSIEVGREMLIPATRAPTSPSEMNFTPVIPNKEEKKKEDLGDKMSKGFDKFVGWLGKTANEISQASKQAAEQMSNKMKDMNLKEELSEFAAKAKVAAKDSVNQVKKGMGEMVDYVKGDKRERESENRLSQEDLPQAPPPQKLTLNQNYEDYFHDPEPEPEHHSPSPGHGVPDDLADIMAPPLQPQHTSPSNYPPQRNNAPQNVSNDLLDGPQQPVPPKKVHTDTFDLLGDFPQTNKPAATKADTKTVDDLI